MQIQCVFYYIGADILNIFRINSVLQSGWSILFFYFKITYLKLGRGGLLVKPLRYKPAGRGFDSRCCHWNFSVTYGPGVDSASNRNEYQVYFLGVKAAGG